MLLYHGVMSILCSNAERVSKFTSSLASILGMLSFLAAVAVADRGLGAAGAGATCPATGKLRSSGTLVVAMFHCQPNSAGANRRK